jgi:cell division protein FtsN
MHGMRFVIMGLVGWEPHQTHDHQPVTTKPVTTKPVTTKPVTTKPVTTKPVTTRPAGDPSRTVVLPARQHTLGSVR